MTTQRLHPNLGAIDLLTKPELQESLANHVDTLVRETARGVKWMRLPLVLQGFATSNAITLGLSTGLVLGPAEGFFWAIDRLVVSGLATGATPDILNLYLNDNFNQPFLWQFNGNNPGYTFGKRGLCLLAGETLSLRNVGSIASTVQITLGGELWQVPAEMMAKTA